MLPAHCAGTGSFSISAISASYFPTGMSLLDSTPACARMSVLAAWVERPCFPAMVCRRVSCAALIFFASVGAGGGCCEGGATGGAGLSSTSVPADERSSFDHKSRPTPKRIPPFRNASPIISFMPLPFVSSP